METVIIAGIAFGAFVLGLIFSPNTKIECVCMGVPLQMERETYREACLQRENSQLRIENSSLRWQYEKAIKYGGRMCCQHCENRWNNTTDEIELKKIQEKMMQAKVTAEDLVKKLSN